jgi:dTDP-4-amino-4,6-dideoxygalactose transaminase
MIKFLDLYAQYLGIQPEIDAAIARVIHDTAFINAAPVKEFEQAFGKYQQVEHCVGVANATDGLEIALEALALPPGAEVIVPANSFIASSEAVTRTGHRVVFADVDPETLTISPADIERRITPRTAAVIAVHVYGHPCDMTSLTALAKQHDLRIIEDCAQAHGAEYRGRRVGAIGDIGVFSFYPGKNLGAYGDGGAITTNDAALAKRCRMIGNHGRVDKYNHEFEGRNSRLDGMQAAILQVKLRHLDEWITRRRAVADAYLRGLADVPGITLPTVRPDVAHAYHLFVIRVQRRDELEAYLKSKEIQTGIHYPIALPKLKAYAHLGQADEPMLANQQDVQLLSLPIGEHLDDAAVDRVISEVRAFSIANS